MASVTVKLSPTIVSGTATVYPVSNWPAWQAISGAPVGSSTTSASVGATGATTFSGLTAGAQYVAYQATPDRYVHFTVPAAAAGGGLPAGGTTGQVLVTTSGGSTAWSSVAGGVLLPSGKYEQVIPSVNDGAIATVNREYVVGLMLAPQTIDRIAFYIGNTPDTGAKLRIGIRADSDGTPGAPAVDQQIAADGGAAWKSLTLSYAHPGGVMWLSWVTQSWATTGPNIDGRAAGAAGPLTAPLVSAAHRSTIDFAVGHTPLVGYQDSVSGALGATFTNAAVTSQRIPTVVLRRA